MIVFLCFSGRVGTRHCEGEFSRGSSHPPPPSGCPPTQPTAPAASDTSQRERCGRVASSRPQICLCLDPFVSPRTIPTTLSLRVKGTHNHTTEFIQCILVRFDTWSMDECYSLACFPGRYHASMQWWLHRKGSTRVVGVRLWKSTRWVHVFALTRPWLRGILGSSNMFYYLISRENLKKKKKWEFDKGLRLGYQNHSSLHTPSVFISSLVFVWYCVWFACHSTACELIPRIYLWNILLFIYL